MRRHLVWTFGAPPPADGAAAVALEPLEQVDLPALAALFADAYRGTIDDEGEGPAEALAELRACIAGKYGPLLPDASGFVGPPADPDGAVLLCVHTLNGLTLPFVVYVVVHPRAQRQGLADAMVRAAAARLQADGHAGLHAVVTVGNTASERLCAGLGLVERPRPPARGREELARALRQRVDAKTKPPGALGALEALAVQLGLLQGSERPALRRPRLLLFAGDHGAVADGASAWPSAVTAQMVINILHGGAASAVFARLHGVELRVVDAGVAAELGPHPALTMSKIGTGTASWLHGPAMTADQRRAAEALGAAVFAEARRDGVDALLVGEMGIGNSASAALLTHGLTGAPLAGCVGPGAGQDAAGLVRKRAICAAAWTRAGLEPGGASAERLAEEFGGFEIVAMAGAMQAAAAARVPVLVDGFIASAAALWARARWPDRPWADALVLSHQSAEPGAAAQLAALGGRPLLDLGLRLGEGTGALLAWPLVRAALAFLDEMATFEAAGVGGDRR
jgi:nicotinate-nucleotide--dimethylbenzimidazole phosphoribosyltransferase